MSDYQTYQKHLNSAQNPFTIFIVPESPVYLNQHWQMPITEALPAKLRKGFSFLHVSRRFSIPRKHPVG